MDANSINKSSNKGVNLGISVLVIGVILLIAGATLKVQHWPGGSQTLLGGMFIEAVAIIILIINLIVKKK